MGRSRSDQERKRWLAEKQSSASPKSKRSQWMTAKSENEQHHVHFTCSCLSCAQQFEICGLPCFVICPNCHLVLILRFS